MICIAFQKVYHDLWSSEVLYFFVGQYANSLEQLDNH